MIEIMKKSNLKQLLDQLDSKVTILNSIKRYENGELTKKGLIVDIKKEQKKFEK